MTRSESMFLGTALHEYVNIYEAFHIAKTLFRTTMCKEKYPTGTEDRLTSLTLFYVHIYACLNIPVIRTPYRQNTHIYDPVILQGPLIYTYIDVHIAVQSNI